MYLHSFCGITSVDSWKIIYTTTNGIAWDQIFFQNKDLCVLDTPLLFHLIHTTHRENPHFMLFIWNRCLFSGLLHPFRLLVVMAIIILAFMVISTPNSSNTSLFDAHNFIRIAHDCSTRTLNINKTLITLSHKFLFLELKTTGVHREREREKAFARHKQRTRKKLGILYLMNRFVKYYWNIIFIVWTTQGSPHLFRFIFSLQ